MVDFILLMMATRSFASTAVYSFSGSGYKKPYFSINSICLSMHALKENGYGSLVTETVNANTLASFIKEQREITGEEVPSWLGDTVSTYEKVSVGISKCDKRHGWQ